jgi:peptide deformylase
MPVKPVGLRETRGTSATIGLRPQECRHTIAREPANIDRCAVFCSNPFMALLDIVTVPDPVLRAPCVEVSDFGARLHTLLDNMFDSMLANNGIGLAAPQVAISEKIAIIDISSDYIQQPTITSHSNVASAQHIHQQRLELINPRIVSRTDQVPSEEGCLSIPDYRDTIKRAYTVSVEAQDRHGRAFSATVEDLLAFAIQHEVDHLNGILFVDHLSRLKKNLFKRWLVKNFGTDAV